jgi:hypothetical protein
MKAQGKQKAGHRAPLASTLCVWLFLSKNLFPSQK